ncbi:MAG: hypothetical protein IJN86_00455 [Clostridia bacterium]|nr:hypothetical protein [Clostridia bacterium]
MKRLTAILLVMAMMLTPAFFEGASTKASAAIVKTEIGNVYFSRINNLWTDSSSSPANNQCNIITPGYTLDGLYYDRLYAVYDSSAGGYVVQKKVATHRSYSQYIGTGAIGIAISNQTADSNKGSDFARKNYAVFQQIRVGDVLTLHNVDLTNKTISTSGTWGSSSYTSNSYISVTTVRDTTTPKTAYSDKTIVALGDSVTAGGGWTEDISIEFNCNVINVATPGDRTNEGLNRFDTLVAPHNPDIVIIKYALNDCIQYTVTASNLTTFKNNLMTLYNKCTALGATVVFMTTNDCSPGLDGSRYSAVGGLDYWLSCYQQTIRDVAAATSGFCIDVYAEWAKITANNYLMDSVHPNASGYNMDLGVILPYLRNNMEAIAGSTGPSITVPSSVDYGSSVNVKWDAVEGATSYKYSVTRHMGEKDITNKSVVYSGTTSSTSISVPAQTEGKYLDVTVTAVTADGEASSTQTVMIGYPAAYPDDIEYIPLAEINGSVLNSTSMIWTASKGSTFSAVYWAAMVCTPNKDGTYTVSEKYENGASKSVTVSGNNILYAVHGSYTNASYANKVKVGDTIEFCGLYLTSNNTLSAKAYVKFNGGIPLHPDDLTVKDTSVALEDDYLVGVGNGVSGSDIISKFNEDSQYIKVYNPSGAEVTNGVVGTGYTVNLVVDNTAIKTITIIISGDLNSDGATTTSDVLVASGSIDGSSRLSAAFIKAGDYDKDGILTTTDYMTLCGKL